MKDSAGNERTVEQVEMLARTTLGQMSTGEVADMLIEAAGGVGGLPETLTRCDCHGLWYDECELYR